MAIQYIYPRDNDALEINPPGGDAHITTRASNWLWAVFAIMLLSWFTALGWTYSVCPTLPYSLRFLLLFLCSLGQQA